MSADTAHCCPGCKKPIRMEGRKPGERVICPGCYRTATVAQIEGPNGAELRLVTNDQAKKQAPPIPRPPIPAGKSNPTNVAVPKGAAPPVRLQPALPHAPQPQTLSPTQIEPPAASQPFNIKDGLVPLLKNNMVLLIVICCSIVGVSGILVAIRALGHKPDNEVTALQEATKPADRGETKIVADSGTKSAAPDVEPVVKPAPAPVITSTPTAPAPSPTVPPVLSDEELVGKCDKSVCLIKTPMATGTGFIVGPKLIATNEHVIGISELKDVKLIFPSQHNASFERPELAFAVWKTDLILLRVPDLPLDYPVLPVAQMSDLVKFETLTVMGFPLGLNRESMATQVKYGSKQVINEADMLTLSGGGINPGNSGGPALNKRGYVAGVVTLKNRGEGIGHAIPCDTLAGALNDMKNLRPADLEHRVADWHAKQLASKLFEGCRLCAILSIKDPFKGLSFEKKGKLLEVYDQRFGVDVASRLQFLKRTNIDPLDLETLEKMSSRYQELSEQTRQRAPNMDRLADDLGQLKTLADRFTKRLGMMDYTDAEDFLRMTGAAER